MVAVVITKYGADIQFGYSQQLKPSSEYILMGRFGRF